MKSNNIDIFIGALLGYVYGNWLFLIALYTGMKNPLIGSLVLGIGILVPIIIREAKHGNI